MNRPTEPTTIRRNATKKIRTIANSAIRVEDFNSMNQPSIVEVTDVEAAMVDFFEFGEGTVSVSTTIRSKDGQHFEEKSMVCRYFRGRSTRFVISSREVTV